jgi:nucleotidyltransferase substrate binding protein (TIGR01987 family)
MTAMPPFNLEPLQKAVEQLEKGLRQVGAVPGDDLVRDGIIQRFEYTVDLCWKFLQRYLKDIAQVDDAIIRTKKDLFREGARVRLIPDAATWIAHYEARNETSHTYNAEVATRVFERARMSAADARNLLEALRDATSSSS